MRTNQHTPAAQPADPTQTDVDELIDELPKDSMENRRADELWVKYCFCHFVREAERICNELNMSPKERQAVLAGQWKAFDWRDRRQKEFQSQPTNSFWEKM